jgi:hypothetical protein
MPSTFETARKIALTFGNVEEGTSYGTPALKVNGQLFARLKEDNDSLVVHMDREQRTEMLAADPDTYYITDHYLNYPWILVRLSRIHPGALRDLLLGAWRSVAAASKRRASPRRGPVRSRSRRLE